MKDSDSNSWVQPEKDVPGDVKICPLKVAMQKCEEAENAVQKQILEGACIPTD